MMWTVIMGSRNVVSKLGCHWGRKSMGVLGLSGHQSSVITTTTSSSSTLLLKTTNKKHSILKTNLESLGVIKLMSSSSSDNDVTKEEKENIYTIPNALCFSRIALSPWIAYLISTGADYKVALAFFTYAGLTDLADGWIARNFKGQSSMLGSFLDPLADKILVMTMYLSLTYVDLIPAPLTALVVSRDVFLLFAGVCIRYMSLTPPVRPLNII